MGIFGIQPAPTLNDVSKTAPLVTATPIPLYGQDANAYYNKGLSYYNLGEYQRAIQDHDEAIRLDPQYAQAYYYRGVAYGLLGDAAQAERDKAKAKELGYSP